MLTWHARLVRQHLAESRAWERARREAIAWSRFTEKACKRIVTEADTAAFALQLYAERLQGAGVADLELRITMLDFSALRFESLPATATYSHRAWGWFPSQPHLPEGDGLGRLTIECVKGNRKESTQYVVEELDPLPGLMGRQFRLTKLDDVTAYIMAIGGLESCSCMAGQTRAKEKSVCKHRDAVRALIARGLLGGDPGLAENERSGLWILDDPGEPTIAELEATASKL